MRLVKLTDQQYEALRGLYGEQFAPPKPKRKPVRQVTLDSRFTDPELVNLYTVMGLLDQIASWKNKTMLVRLALGTGLRVAEMARLTVSVDPNNETMASCKRSGVITVRNAKGGKTRDARCIPEFQPWYNEHIDWLVENFEPDDNGLIPFFGEVYDRVTLWRWWTAVIKKCEGVRALRLHDARHTYGSWELLRLKEVEVNALMGHCKPDVFRKFYAGILAERIYNGDADPHWYKAALGKFYQTK